MTIHEEAVLEYVIDKLVGLESGKEDFKSTITISINNLKNLIKSQYNKRGGEYF